MIRNPRVSRVYGKAKLLKERSLDAAWSRIHHLPPIKYVQIQTHSNCNADCVFCPYTESWHAKNRGKMTDEMFDKVLDDLKPFAFGINRGKVCPYLMQEPLLDPKLFERIEKIYNHFPETMVEIATNGILLRDKTIDRLLDILPRRRHEIRISHHGIDNETMKHIMKIDYNVATTNILNLIKRANGRLKIMIRGAGVSRKNKIRYFDRQQYLDHWDFLLNKECAKRENLSINFFTFHDRAGTIHRHDRDADKNKEGVVRLIDPQHPFHCCRLDQWLHIMYDGTIRLCCMDYHGEVALPSLADISLLEYFRSSAYTNLVHIVTGKVKSHDDFICKRCISPGG